MAIVWGAYTISYILVGYTIGLMQSFPLGNSLFTVWALCLALILGSVDSLSAYSLDDNDKWKRFYAQYLGYQFSVGVLLGTYGAPPDLQVPLWAIYAIVILSFTTRTTSFQAASKSYGLSDSTKWVADYMSYEHELEDALVPNPITMHGYRYVVAGEDCQKYKPEPPDYLLKYKGDAIKLVTVEQIWQCSGKLLRSESEEGQGLKDICLSMALSKMLNRRYAGLRLSESKLPKTHDFVFRGLLSGDMGYERAFRVIEVELGFVHDFFYTKYYVLYTSHPFFALLLPALSSPFCLWLAYLLFGHFHTRNDDSLAVGRSNHRNYDALVTMVIVLGIALLQLLQVYFYIASDWFKVYLISKYVKKPTWQSNEQIEKIIAFVVRWRKPFRYWENMIGQYSLLDNFNYTSKNVLYHLTFSLVDETKKGRKEEKSIDLPNEVRQAVINSFVRSSGRLTKGITSLSVNQVEQLLWTCNDVPTVTHTILIWHIATTLCDHTQNGGGDGRQPSDEDERSEMKTHALVASSLSKYCAYLVAFAPDLLPDHSFDSATIFDALIYEASELLKGPESMQHRYSTLMSMGVYQEDKRLIVMGARLGMQLVHEITDPRQRWKVLHDFWAEMMLYIAPSNDTRAHLETLTRGGEFITHLWALLTHAGILERDDSAGTP